MLPTGAVFARSPLIPVVAAALLVATACAAPAPAPAPTRIQPSRLPQSLEMPAVAWFDDYNEVLSGTITRYGFLLPRTLDLKTQVGNARCVGGAPVKVMPPAALPPARCDGVRGMAQLNCSDGRALLFEWSADPDCASGFGKGRDADGNLLHLVYGGSPERAKTALKEAVRAQARMPALPATGGEEAHGIGTGTAFFVSWDGHLLTNHHVIDKATRVQVKLDDGDLVDAQVLSRDPDNDLALLKVKAIRRPLPIRRTNDLARGTEIMVLGYPLVTLQGADQKATFGHVNALKGMQGDDRYTQVDAPVQPGQLRRPVDEPERGGGGRDHRHPEPPGHGGGGRRHPAERELRPQVRLRPPDDAAPAGLRVARREAGHLARKAGRPWLRTWRRRWCWW